eukprot:scaffold239375_cov43-Tisochrysis_lutea.AAC.1
MVSRPTPWSLPKARMSDASKYAGSSDSIVLHTYKGGWEVDDKAGPSDSGSERGELGFPPYKAIRDVSFRFRSADLRVMIFSRRVAYSSHSPGCTSGGGVPNIKSRAQKGWERSQGVLRPGSAFEEAWESAE